MKNALGNRNDTDDGSPRLAVLIDADNAQASVIEPLLAEIAKFGEATVKRIYGDFTAPTSAQWKKALNKHAIKPVQQFAYTKGKNATDSTLIIDAMDLLYTGRFGGFCLVSSDSDFTGLALRIKEEGLIVLGFGEQKTPDAFRNACHKFIFTEVLRPSSESDKPSTKSSEGKPRKGSRGGKKPTAAAAPSPSKATARTTDAVEDDERQNDQRDQHAAGGKKEFPRAFVVEALNTASDEDGWADLGTFANYLTKLQPDFDPRLYGFKKLSALVKAKKELFEIEERQPPGATQKVFFIRAK
jgi:hypothetical protein